MKAKLIQAAVVILLFSSSYVLAEEGHGHHDHMGTMMQDAAKESVKPINVGNKICPISGQKIGEMGPPVPYEHNGKIYNLCCMGCVESFKNDPQKYVKIVEEEMAGEKIALAKEETLSKAEVKEFDLEVYQFGYSPETIVVYKGDRVKIAATSRDVPHGIFIKEYGIKATVQKGTVEEIEFIADKSGEFDILCSVYCGRGHHSMTAKLIVKE